MRASKQSRAIARCLAFAALLIAGTSRATELYHVDLQQAGSATIIRQPTPEGMKTILVDTGNRSAQAGRGGAAVLEQLRRLGIDHVDLLIVTHMDADHYAGFESLLELPGALTRQAPNDVNAPRGPPVGVVLRPKFDKGNDLVQRFRTAFADRGIPIVIPEDGQPFDDLASRFGIEVLKAPEPGSNNASSFLVSVINDGDVANGVHVITGDMTAASWREIASHFPSGRRVLSMTAPHHGGDEVLLPMVDALHPEVVVMSANRNNQFRHPSLRVLRDLARRAYPATPDLRTADVLLGRAYELASADREFLEILQDFYRVSKRDLQSPAVAEAQQLKRQGATDTERMIGTAPKAMLSTRLRITGEHGTIRQRGARLVESSQTLRERVIAEATMRAVARLTDAQIAQLRSWDNARRQLRAAIEGELDILALHYGRMQRYEEAVKAVSRTKEVRPEPGRPDAPPLWIAEYRRIVMDLEGVPDRQPAVVEEKLRAATARTRGERLSLADRTILLPQPLPPERKPDPKPLRDLREMIGRLKLTDRRGPWEMQKLVIPPQFHEVRMPLPSQASQLVGGTLLPSEYWGTGMGVGRRYEDVDKPVREREFTSDRDLPRPPGEREDRPMKRPVDPPRVEIKPPL